MNEDPEVPAPPPEVPENKLWRSLLIPPFITLSSVMAIEIVYPSGGMEFLLVWPLGLLAIFVGLGKFISAWKVRYRGLSLVLYSIGYFLSQIFLCLGLGYALCSLVIN